MANFEQIFFEPCQNFVISIRKLDFYENIIKITITVLKKFFKEAFTQLLIIFSHYSVKMDQSQPAFFFGTEEVLFKESY